MEKNFDGWNERKKHIHAERYGLNINQREWWWISFGINIGVEIDGKENFERSGIVLRKFNPEMAWVIPVTTQEKSSKFYVRFEFEGKSYWAALTQIRTLSIKRFLRQIGMIHNDIFIEMQRRIAAFVRTEET